MKTTLTIAARQDYANAYGYGLEYFGVTRAEAYADRLDAAFDLLARNPKMGRARPEIGEDTRSLVIGSHIAFYRISDDGIEILRIRHQHEDWMGATTGSDADHPDDHPD